MRRVFNSSKCKRFDLMIRKENFCNFGLECVIRGFLQQKGNSNGKIISIRIQVLTKGKRGNWETTLQNSATAQFKYWIGIYAFKYEHLKLDTSSFGLAPVPRRSSAFSRGFQDQRKLVVGIALG